MRVSKWYLIPALLIGVGLGWVIFSSADVDPLIVMVISIVLALSAGFVATRAGA